MTVADSAGRFWQATKVGIIAETRKEIENWFTRTFGRLLTPKRVLHHFVEDDQLSLQEFKERICEAMRSNPDYWRDEEANCGCHGPLRTEAEMLEALQSKIRSAGRVEQIVAVLIDNDAGCYD